MAIHYDFSLDTPFRDLPRRIRDMFLLGNNGEILTLDTTNSKFNHGSTYKSSFEGVVPSLERRHSETGSDDMKEYYEQYMSVSVCPVCHGARLKPESLSVTVGKKSINELTLMPIRKEKDFLNNLHFSKREAEIAERIIKELNSRLGF